MRRSCPFALVGTISSASALSQSSSVIPGNSFPWRHVTVEWNPKVAKLQESQPDAFAATTHWVFPDLPNVFTAEHRTSYWHSTRPRQRIQTLATCQHTTWKSLVETAKERLEWTDDEGGKGKLLLVGGNSKTAETISTVEAATILRSELHNSVELWAVADPNDPESITKVQWKMEAGIAGFLTQPPLTSIAWETLPCYPSNEVPIVVGMALPRTAQNLQFWRRLLDRPELLEQDPLFRSHMAYFSQPYTTPLAWIGRELQQCMSIDPKIDGVHFMPLQNTDDLTTLLKSLSVQLGRSMQEE